MINSFLNSVLGRGHAVIDNLIKAAPQTESVVVPRTILSWVRSLESYSEGSVPGTEIRYCFAKSIGGWSGGIDFKKQETVHLFCEADDEYLASIVMVALDVNLIDSSLVKNIDIARLGKTLDLLVKNHVSNIMHDKQDTNIRGEHTEHKKPEPPKLKEPLKKPRKPKTMFKDDLSETDVDADTEEVSEKPTELFDFLREL